jgi:HD-GYP domain-containing protein (c-di-GMP phosphodiesterase class II)
MAKTVSAIISNLMTAALNCSLYSQEHNSVIQYSAKTVRDMEEFFQDDNTLSFAILGSTFLMNEKKVSERSLHISNFTKRLRRKGIDKVVFRRGLDSTELSSFIAAMVSPSGTPKSSEHIQVGTIEVKLSSGLEGDVSDQYLEDVEKVQEIDQHLKKFGTLDMIGIEDVIMNFMSSLQRENNVLNIVSPVKAHSDYTFAHTSNVTVLSIFIAESLGLKGDILHEIGLAGLLHDVGKAFIPLEVLDKPGQLDDREWEAMRNHTTYGAMYLSSIPDVPKLAVIAAYEHHMKFNGSGYPEPRWRGKRQHIVSQMIAIADTFDALRTERPYRSALEVPVVLGILEDIKDKDLNPVLVDHFVASLKKVGAA